METSPTSGLMFNKFVRIDLTYNYPEDDEFGLQNMVKEYEVKSWYTWALHDLDDKFIGVLSVSFTKKPHKFTKDEWIFIRQKIGVIGSLLSSYLYYQTEKRS